MEYSGLTGGIVGVPRQVFSDHSFPLGGDIFVPIWLSQNIMATQGGEFFLAAMLMILKSAKVHLK